MLCLKIMKTSGINLRKRCLVLQKGKKRDKKRAQEVPSVQCGPLMNTLNCLRVKERGLKFLCDHPFINYRSNTQAQLYTHNYQNTHAEIDEA